MVRTRERITLHFGLRNSQQIALDGFLSLAKIVSFHFGNVLYALIAMASKSSFETFMPCLSPLVTSGALTFKPVFVLLMYVKTVS